VGGKWDFTGRVDAVRDNPLHPGPIVERLELHGEVLILHGAATTATDLISSRDINCAKPV
jgi:hypothetical protein